MGSLFNSTEHKLSLAVRPGGRESGQTARVIVNCQTRRKSYEEQGDGGGRKLWKVHSKFPKSKVS